MTVALISTYDHWSAGNRSLHAVLNREGIETDLIFLHTANDSLTPPARKSFDALITLLKDMKPELVGISLRTQFWWIGRRIARRIKEELNVPVVLGGVHVTLNPEECIKEADIICRGEGEAALPEIVRRLREGKPVHDIPGLWTRMPDGTIVRNDPTIAVHDMYSLPLHVTDRSHFITLQGDTTHCDPVYDDRELTLYAISASRGCPFRCSYCCESIFKNIFKDEGIHIRQRSVENLFEEFKFVKNRFPKLISVAFSDEVFHPRPEWMSEFVNRYKQEFGKSFSVMIHPGLVSDKWIESLQQTGAEFCINFGLQSGSERVRKEVFDRPTSNKSLNRVKNILNNYNYLKTVDIIVDNPFETAEEFRETVQFILQLKRPIFVPDYALMFFPELPITKRALAAGYITEKNMPGYAEDIIELWISGLGDPRGDHLKTWLKVIVHLHQLKMCKLFGPPKEYNPIPIWLLRFMAKKKKVSPREAKAAAKAHNLLVRLALKTYLWGGRVQVMRELMAHRKFGEIFYRISGFIKRALKPKIAAKNKS